MLPAEYFDTLSEVLSFGLKHSYIDPKLRQELFAWWEVEKEFIEEKLNELK